jgi:hypothetical protein
MVDIVLEIDLPLTSPAQVVGIIEGKAECLHVYVKIEGNLRCMIKADPQFQRATWTT